MTNGSQPRRKKYFQKCFNSRTMKNIYHVCHKNYNIQLKDNFMGPELWKVWKEFGKITQTKDIHTCQGLWYKLFIVPTICKITPVGDDCIVW